MSYNEVVSTGVEHTTFDGGARREIIEGNGRFDLIPPEFLIRLAKHYENGAKKYSQSIQTSFVGALNCITEVLQQCENVQSVKGNFIVKDYVGVAMRKVYEQEIQNLFSDNEITPISGEKNTQNGSVMPTKDDEKTQCAENEIKKPNTEVHYAKEDSQNKAVVYCCNGKIIPVRYVDDILITSEQSILTMTIKQKWQEVTYVVVATTDLECLKTLLMCCKKQFRISKIQQLNSSLETNKDVELRISGDRNWEKGIPFSSLYNSAFRHMNKYMLGLKDEDHLVACIWNLIAILTFEERNMQDLNDLPTLDGKSVAVV